MSRLPIDFYNRFDDAGPSDKLSMICPGLKDPCAAPHARESSDDSVHLPPSPAESSGH